MDVRIGILILAVVTLTAIAQITLKFGMSGQRVTDAFLEGNNWTTASTIATTPAIVGGLALYFLSAMLWLIVLAQVDVTQAYPFVGLGFLITMVLGIILLGESVSLARVAGTILVATGVILVARS